MPRKILCHFRLILLKHVGLTYIESNTIDGTDCIVNTELKFL